MKRLTGSGLDLAAECPASFALPFINRPSDACDRGTAIHKYLQNGGDRFGIPEEHLEECISLDLDDIYLTGLCQAPTVEFREAKFVFLPGERVVEFLGEGGDRSYPDKGIPFTVDRMFFDGETAYVQDYKTGAEPPAPTSLQIGVAALAADSILNAKGYTPALIKGIITHIPPSHSIHKGVSHSFADYDMLTMWETAEKIVGVYNNVKAEKGAMAVDGTPSGVVVGPHCKYCDAKAFCPSTNALVKNVFEYEKLDIRGHVHAMTMEQLGAAWEKLDLAKKIIADMDDSIKERLESVEELDLPSGGKLKRSERTYRSINAKKAIPVLTNAGILPEIKESIDIGAIDRAAKEAGKKPANIWRMLYDADAVKTSKGFTFRRVK